VLELKPEYETIEELASFLIDVGIQIAEEVEEPVVYR